VDQIAVIQKRPPSSILAGVGSFLAVAVLLNLIGVSNILVVGVLGGGALGAAMASLTKNYYLVGLESEVRMVQLTTWSGRPETEVKSLPRPLDVTISKGLLMKSVVIDGEKFILSKLFADELDALASPE
jgi:hypothetical protein